jgi:3-deoxy-D-manno-octulosonate 8-phosphate phosphatase (KDO 8-P phosphatase)
MLEEVRPIRLLAMDVDGVLTDGSVMYSDSGQELKVFDIHDGLGISVARFADLTTAIITGRKSFAVERRAGELGIAHLCQGCRNKGVALRKLIETAGVTPSETAFIGDDINDLPAFRECGFRIAVANASNDLKAQADHVTERTGGRGAVREVIELILRSQGKWDIAVEEYLRELEQSG